MYLITISFIVGLYIKAISLALKNFNTQDVGVLIFATIMHIYVFANAFKESISFNTSLLLGSIAFVVVVASAFKKRIVPTITEGTLLLYGLIALWLFVVNLDTSSAVSIIVTILTALYCCAVLALCITKVRTSPKIQTILVVIFLLFNIGISFLFFSVKDFVAYFEIGTFDYLIQLKMMMFGYMVFQLLSNVLYIAYFLPFVGKNQSMRSRINSIKRHAEELRTRYVDIDVSYTKTIAIFFLVALLFINTFFPFVQETTTLIAAVLIIGTIITTWYGEGGDIESDSQHEMRDVFRKKAMLVSVMIFLVASPYMLHALSVRLGLNSSSILTKDSFMESLGASSANAPIVSVPTSEASLLIDEGLREYRNHDYVRAELLFRKALVFEADNKYAYNNLGITLFFQERFEEAEAAYVQAITLDAQYANAHNNIGKLYEFTNQYERALTHLNQALMLEPRAETFITRGDVYAQMNNNIQALNDYMTARTMGVESFSLEEKIRVFSYKVRQL